VQVNQIWKVGRLSERCKNREKKTRNGGEVKGRIEIRRFSCGSMLVVKKGVERYACRSWG